jgi:hypothetical protein
LKELVRLLKLIFSVSTRRSLLPNDGFKAIGLIGKLLCAFLKTTFIAVVAKSCQTLSTLQA